MTARPERLYWRWAAVALVALCAACDDDPTAAETVCGDQPTLTVDATVEAALTDADMRFAGAYIDYYGLQLDAPAELTLALSSTAIRPLLLVFDDTGTVTAQAFQVDATAEDGERAATLTATFDAGCTLVGASAYGPNETGPYALTADPTS